MHTIWKGSISFGLVNIPIRMYVATKEKNISFRQLHKVCKTPIQYKKMCPTCREEVSVDEIVKGYEYADHKFVILDKEELDAIAPDNRKSIEIIDFVQLKEIDPMYYDRTYYLGPGDTGEKAYSLLRDAMQTTEKIGVAQITIRSKQSLAVVRVFENCLVMETIFYPDEVRNPHQVPGVPADMTLPEKEMSMAQQLIENLTTTFEPEKYEDDYRKKLEEAIDMKVKGEEIIEAPEQQPERVVDLMEALKASLEQSGSKKKKTAK